MNKKVRKQYARGGVPGLVVRRTAHQTGTLVGVYHAKQSGLGDGGDGEWYTVCEEHGNLVGHETRALAIFHMSDPEGWCEGCNGGPERQAVGA